MTDKVEEAAEFFLAFEDDDDETTEQMFDDDETQSGQELVDNIGSAEQESENEEKTAEEKEESEKKKTIEKVMADEVETQTNIFAVGEDVECWYHGKWYAAKVTFSSSWTWVKRPEDWSSWKCDKVRKLTSKIQMQDHSISPWGCEVDFKSRGLPWVVTKVKQGMQCSELGIEKGWKIIKCNDVVINDTNSAHIEAYLRAGKPGTITLRKCKLELKKTEEDMTNEVEAKSKSVVIQMKDHSISPWGCEVDFKSRGLPWVVTKVRQEMQCSENGIEKGWKIIKCNDVVINDTNSAHIEAYLRAGKPGTITFKSESADIQMQDHSVSPWGCEIDFKSSGLPWVVTKVKQGMQCSEHGIKKGWKIIKWNGDFINDTNSAKIEGYLRAGNPGTITFRKYKYQIGPYKTFDWVTSREGVAITSSLVHQVAFEKHLIVNLTKIAYDAANRRWRGKTEYGTWVTIENEKNGTHFMDYHFEN